jgi:predicted nucleic acid-binding protein
MVIYWDASAILSLLIEDRHSEKAIKVEKQKGIHFTSTLGIAETHAVLKRMNHEKVLTDILYESAVESFENRMIRKINTQPDRTLVRELSSQYVLKGADLWHLAVVKTIRSELPEVVILSFDKQLTTAAEREGIVFLENRLRK